jgi:hypothetical protein
MLRSGDWKLVTDVSGQPIGLILEFQAARTFKMGPIGSSKRSFMMGPIGCPETSVTNLRCVTSQKSENLKIKAFTAEHKI